MLAGCGSIGTAAQVVTAGAATAGAVADWLPREQEVVYLRDCIFARPMFFGDAVLDAMTQIELAMLHGYNCQAERLCQGVSSPECE